jgi:hypothetical protein
LFFLLRIFNISKQTILYAFQLKLNYIRYFIINQDWL